MKYIDAEKLIAEIRKHLIPTILDRDYDEWEKGKDVGLQQAIGIVEALQQEPRFPQYDNIVDKVFGAGNLEGFEYREAEMLVALAKEELLKSLQQEQTPTEREIAEAHRYAEMIRERDKARIQQEQPDFPTTDEQMKEFLATHPKIEVPEKYKNPDWLFKKQEQPKVDLVAKLKHHLDTTPKEQLEKEWKELEPWCNIGPTVQEYLYGKQPDVDLEKEIDRYCEPIQAWQVQEAPFTSLENCARHFYELGLNARNEI